MNLESEVAKQDGKEACKRIDPKIDAKAIHGAGGTMHGSGPGREQA
jgi:hypothetical protein